MSIFSEKQMPEMISFHLNALDDFDFLPCSMIKCTGWLGCGMRGGKMPRRRMARVWKKNKRWTKMRVRKEKQNFLFR